MNIYSHDNSKTHPWEKPLKLTSKEAADLAQLFSTLSDPSRVRIISLLANKDMNVQELSESLQMSHSAVSHQLRGLRQSRVVRADKNGRYAVYTLDDEHIAQLFQYGLDHIQHE